ncbi:MAG: hypothetical protein LBR98_00305 [Syntrophomonadaceae bacterium]|jgi:hypothetical protein|nr:hypothetical protein [Syntrophomonadaceae bacterium]
MLLSFDETAQKIANGKLLHIAGTENLLKKLPKGNWIGGSTEYFMAKEGGKITNALLFVTEFPYDEFQISTYDGGSISSVTADAYDNGFSIVILPFDSVVHKTYAQKAPEFEGMFIKNIAGWIAGVNLDVPGQTPVTVNGQTCEVYTDKAIVAHVCVPDDKLVSIGIVNIFSQDETSPVIEFTEEGFSVKTCLVNGKETVFADYVAQNGIDTKFPLVGDYSGIGVNISFKFIEDSTVNFYAPVFPGIKYRMAKSITDYVAEFNGQLEKFKSAEAVFSCNCILNFLYGELEGKDIEVFHGPITFGEVAYQLVNQTLVYVTVL